MKVEKKINKKNKVTTSGCSIAKCRSRKKGIDQKKLKCYEKSEDCYLK